jgi:hypothetical protein
MRSIAQRAVENALIHEHDRVAMFPPMEQDARNVVDALPVGKAQRHCMEIKVQTLVHRYAVGASKFR